MASMSNSDPASKRRTQPAKSQTPSGKASSPDPRVAKFRPVGPPMPSIQEFGQAIVDNLNRQTATKH